MVICGNGVQLCLRSDITYLPQGFWADQSRPNYLSFLIFHLSELQLLNYLFSDVGASCEDMSRGGKKELPFHEVFLNLGH